MENTFWERVLVIKKKMVTKTTPYICSRENEFLKLKGDGTESVMVTIDHDKLSDVNGWYVFLKTDKGGNRFVKQSLNNLPLIDMVLCETKYIQFDGDNGLSPNSFQYHYRPIGVNHEEYEGLKAKLEEVGEWKPIKQVTRWEFEKD